MSSLQMQIEEHEAELNQMIEALTDEQMESLRTTVEYLRMNSLSQRSVQQINFDFRLWKNDSIYDKKTSIGAAEKE